MNIHINWRGNIVKAELIQEGTNVKDESMRKEILKTMMGYKFNALPAPSPLQRKTFTLSYNGFAQIPW